MVTKELRFETEDNTQNYEMDDLNTLLQLNDDTHNYENLPLKVPENTSILHRHPVIQSELSQTHQVNIFKELQSLTEPISIANTSIYEPFHAHIFSCLKSLPLTSLKLKLSKHDEWVKMVQKCTELLYR